jgi:hypothetical protein
LFASDIRKGVVRHDAGKEAARQYANLKAVLLPLLPVQAMPVGAGGPTLNVLPAKCRLHLAVGSGNALASCAYVEIVYESIHSTHERIQPVAVEFMAELRLQGSELLRERGVLYLWVFTVCTHG